MAHRMGIRKRIQGLHDELAMLPKVFGKIIDASNAYEEARRMSEGTDCLKYLVGNMSNVSGLHDYDEPGNHLQTN